jgi:hypothetical protein
VAQSGSQLVRAVGLIGRHGAMNPAGRVRYNAGRLIPKSILLFALLHLPVCTQRVRCRAGFLHWGVSESTTPRRRGCVDRLRVSYL